MGQTEISASGVSGNSVTPVNPKWNAEPDGAFRRNDRATSGIARMLNFGLNHRLKAARVDRKNPTGYLFAIVCECLADSSHKSM